MFSKARDKHHPLQAVVLGLLPEYLQKGPVSVRKA